MSAAHSDQAYSDQDRALYRLYCQTLARFDMALRVARGLCDRDRNIAGLMLAFASWATFRNSGAVACWIGVDTLAESVRDEGKKPDRTRIQRAHRALRKAGVIQVRTPGGGRGRTTIHEFSMEWLERITADAERWAPAPIRAKLRLGLAAQGAALSDGGYSGTDAAVSDPSAALSAQYSGTGAAVSVQSAALSAQNGGAGAALSDESAALSGSGAALSGGFSGTSAALSAQGAALYGQNGGAGAAVSDVSAAVSPALGAGVPVGPAGTAVSGASGDVIGGTSAAVSGQNTPLPTEKGGSGVVKRAAPVQPENIDLKTDKSRRPAQLPLLMGIRGGRSVEAVAREEQSRSRALAAVENDGRFEKLRAEAARILGDAKTANLAISVMDEHARKRILRGIWPTEAELRRLLGDALDLLGSSLPSLTVHERDSALLSGDPVQRFPAEEARPEIREDRIERMAVQASQQAAEALQGMQVLQGQISELTGLLRHLVGGNGQTAAVA